MHLCIVSVACTYLHVGNGKDTCIIIAIGQRACLHVLYEPLKSMILHVCISKLIRILKSVKVYL